MCETLRRVVSVYTSNIGTFTKIAAAYLSVIIVVWSLVLLPLLLTIMGVKGTDFDDPEFLASHLADYVVLSVVNYSVTIVSASIGGGALCRALAELYAGQRPNWIACLRVSVKKAPSVLLATLLAFIGTALGFLFLIIPGVYFSIAVVLFVPAIVVENVGAVRSLSRSAELVSGSWCYVWCTFLAATVPVMAVQFLWSGLLLGSSGVGSTMFSVKGSIVSMVPVLLFGPIYAGVQFAMYINMRVQKESLNLEILVNDVMGEPSSGEVSYSDVARLDEEEPDLSVV